MVAAPHINRITTRNAWTDQRHVTLIKQLRTSGLSSLNHHRLPGGASRLAALLLPQILPVFSVVAPCHPGAALRNPVLLQRRQATSDTRSDSRTPWMLSDHQ